MFFVQKRSCPVDIVAFFASICGCRSVSFRWLLLRVWLTTVVTGDWSMEGGRAPLAVLPLARRTGERDRHQKERKRVQGDAGTDLVCSCGPCLLEWCVFLASSRCCYMAGRPFPPRSRLCFVPRQGPTPFLLRHAHALFLLSCSTLLGSTVTGPASLVRPLSIGKTAGQVVRA